jgi:tetraacyldisaccharide 4'-kinase
VSRGWLLPLVPLYRAAAGAKNRAYDHGWLRTDRLRWPVISVGNLSVGGAGKTPLVIRLAELLTQHGLKVDVLSRGYGRSSNRIEVVDANGSPERFGDEPLLIARCTGVPVVLGASRYAAGLLAEQRLDSSARAVHLLDDGFQHRRLARDVDIVVVHCSDLEERLLPAGRLREPVASLARASVMVLREEDADLEDPLRRMGLNAPIWSMRRSVEIPAAARRAIAFCGIARPKEFFLALQQAGVELPAARAFSDHQRYTRRDIDSLIRIARQIDADSFITTEKDAIKLDASLRQRLELTAPVHVVRLHLTLLDEAAVIADLIRQIGSGVIRSLGQTPPLPVRK